MNHFEILNLPYSFSLDLKVLDKQYFAMQIQYHPDQARNNDQKIEFTKMSTQVNEAYQILKKDYTRANYLLKLQDIDIEDESVNYPLPPEILQQIWEDREELEETQNIQSFFSSKVNDREKLLVELCKVFDEANYKMAAILTHKLKYLENLITSAKAKMIL